MIHVAYLASKLTLADSELRLPDAYRHDEDYKALSTGCLNAHIELIAMDWELPIDRFSKFSAAIVRSTWDYVDNSAGFMKTIQGIDASGVPVYNTPNLIKWNISKNYLRELSNRGVPIVPTIWSESPTRDDLVRAFDAFLTDRVVAKRQIGSRAEGQKLFSVKELPAQSVILGRPGMLQPFMENVVNEGEYSFVFIDGEFSHMVLKRPRAGDYRVQQRFGGSEQAVDSGKADLDSARAVMDCLPGDTPIVARIDMVRDKIGHLVVMEVELTEPYLFPKQGPRLGPMFAAALDRRIRP